MNGISYNLTRNSITVVWGDTFNTRIIPNTSQIYGTVVDAARRQDVEALETALKPTPVKTVVDFDGVSKDASGRIMYRGKVLDNALTRIINEMQDEGYDATPFINFLDRLMKNPSSRSVEQLYNFLSHGNFPITPDGFFLGYKGVRDDYKDVHSGKFLNTVGSVHSVPRNEVDDDPSRGCSYGFHVGTQDYARGWGTRMMIVKVDPANCVSVPHDCSHQKLRCCEYEVVAEFTEGKNDRNFAEAPVYSEKAEKVAPDQGIDAPATDAEIGNAVNYVFNLVNRPRRNKKKMTAVNYIDLVAQNGVSSKAVNAALDQGYLTYDDGINSLVVTPFGERTYR